MMLVLLRRLPLYNAVGPFQYLWLRSRSISNTCPVVRVILGFHPDPYADLISSFSEPDICTLAITSKGSTFTHLPAILYYPHTDSCNSPHAASAGTLMTLFPLTARPIMPTCWRIAVRRFSVFRHFCLLQRENEQQLAQLRFQIQLQYAEVSSS